MAQIAGEARRLDNQGSAKMSIASLGVSTSHAPARPVTSEANEPRETAKSNDHDGDDAGRAAATKPPAAPGTGTVVDKTA